VSVTRINQFQAREGQAQALRAHFESIIALIRSSTGCESVQLLKGVEDPTHLAIIEVWESVEAHQAAARNIPPELFQETRALLAGPAKGEYYRS
jgi:quinol monooxygenase YgiN